MVVICHVASSNKQYFVIVVTSTIMFFRRRRRRRTRSAPLRGLCGKCVNVIILLSIMS